MEPLAVIELGFERARARELVFARYLRSHDRLTAGSDHRFIGGAGLDRLIGEVVQLLEIRVAQDKTIMRVPNDERLRNGLDRIAQAQIRFHGLLIDS